MRDPAQYARFSEERSRPFHTLLSRVPEGDFKQIVDLGSGTGELTKSLAERWAGSRVLGIDNSPEMVEQAKKSTQAGRLEFQFSDINDYDESADLIFSNAALQWLDNHESLFPKLASLVRPGGVLAVQMPSSFDQPSHVLLEQTARSGPWAHKLADWRKLQVERLHWYLEMLMGVGLQVDAWEIDYLFVLQGSDPVLEWVKGTSMQPILALLDEAEQAEFSKVYGAALRDAYPPTADGTVYPFKRIFFVASRKA